MRPAPEAHPCQPPGPQNPRPKALDATTHGPFSSRPHGPQALDSTVPEPRAPDPTAPKHPTPQPTPPSNRLHGASVPELPTPEHSTPRPHGPTAPKHPTRRSPAAECMVQGPADRKASPRNQEHPPQAAYAAHEAPALLPPRAGTRPGVGNARSEAALSPLLWTAAAENPHQKRAFL